MVLFIGVLLLLVLAVYAFVRTEPFGSLSAGARKQRIEQSPNYRDGKFQNLSHTPDLTEDASYYSVIMEFFFRKKERPRPTTELPALKTS